VSLKSRTRLIFYSPQEQIPWLHTCLPWCEQLQSPVKARERQHSPIPSKCGKETHLFLANVGHEADDLIALVNEPCEDARGVETARVSQDDASLCHFRRVDCRVMGNGRDQRVTHSLLNEKKSNFLSCPKFQHSARSDKDCAPPLLAPHGTVCCSLAGL